MPRRASQINAFDIRSWTLFISGLPKARCPSLFIKTGKNFDLGVLPLSGQGCLRKPTQQSRHLPYRRRSLRKTRELVVSFVKAHPDLKDKDSADIVRWALTDEFPRHPTDKQRLTPNRPCEASPEVWVTFPRYQTVAFDG
jgi:hypothetical protein